MEEPNPWVFPHFDPPDYLIQWYGKSQTTNDLIFWKVDHLAALQWKAWPAGTWASPNMTLILLLFPLATSVHGTLSKRKTASGCLKHWWSLDPLGSENRSGSNPWVSPSLTSMLYPVTNLDGWKHTFIGKDCNAAFRGGLTLFLQIPSVKYDLWGGSYFNLGLWVIFLKFLIGQIYQLHQTFEFIS